MEGQGAARSSQELRNNRALFLGFAKTHTLGIQPDESEGHIATLLRSATGPDVQKQLAGKQMGPGVSRTSLSDSWVGRWSCGRFYRASKFSGLIPSNQQI